MRIVIAMLLLCCVVACKRDVEPVVAATMAKGQGETPAVPAPASRPAVAAAQPLVVVRAYLDAWNAHDAVRAASYLTEDSEYFDAAFAGKQSGRDAIEQNAIAVFLRGMPDLQWQMRSEPIVGPDGVAYEWTLTGTHTGTWGGVAPTGQKVSLKGMSFVRLRGGRISYQAVVYDSATLNRQLGL